MGVILLASADGQTFHSVTAEQVGTTAQKVRESLQKEKSPHTPLKEKGKVKNPPTPLDLFGVPVEGRARSSKPVCPYAEIYAIAKRFFPDWNFRASTPKRNRKFVKLWRANGQSTSVFEELFQMASDSDFLNARNGHQFKGTLSLSWIIDRCDDILGGKYTNESMDWARLKAVEIEAIVVGEGKQKIDPENFKLVGTDDITGLPKYIRH
jgi:hypothetical protein